MYPLHADEPSGRYPAALLYDPETAEEVREALAVARAEARFTHDEVRRLAAENTRVRAQAAGVWRRLDACITMLTDALATLEPNRAHPTDPSGTLQAHLTGALEQLRAARGDLLALLPEEQQP